MIYGSVCSGIEAATVAWHPLGWKPAFFSEIEKFPRAVLKHHYPEVPLHGDFTTIQAGDYPAISLLVGGTPCQSFSVAGLRGGLDDDRGNLALEYLRLADRLRPRWLVWENVPGVLSSNGGRDFGAILGGMVELGYGFSYRVLDAQHFGVPQRRRRVFVVGYLGDWRVAAAVLFERYSLQGHPAPRREAGKKIAGTLTSSLGRRGGQPNDDNPADYLIASTLNGESGRNQIESTYLPVTGTLNANGKATGNATSQDAECGLLVPLAYGGNNTAGPVQVAAALAAHGGPHGRLNFASETFIAFSAKDHGADAGDIAPTLRAGGHNKSHANAGVMPAIAFQPKASHHQSMNPSDVTPAMDVGKSDGISIHTGSAVRRLTPRECERLQGFPDNYTAVLWRKSQAPDGPRYKALGNSMAVPCMAWIGKRIAIVEDLIHGR